MSTGSQADWIQAIGALVAAVGLVITLFLQWRTSEDQRNFLILEKEKDRPSIMSRFTVSEVTQLKIDDDIITKMILKIENADVFEVFCSTSGDPYIRYNPFTSSHIAKGNIIEITGRYRADSLGSHTIYHSKGVIKFQDIDGRTYEQDVYFNEGIRDLPRLYTPTKRKYWILR